MMHSLRKNNYSEEGDLSLNSGGGGKEKKTNKSNRDAWEGSLLHLLMQKEVRRKK